MYTLEEQNISEFGLLSQIAYGKLEDNIKRGATNEFVDGKGNKKVLQNTYKIIDKADTISGLQALLLKNETTNSYVIAFRGTQGVMDVLTDISPLEIL